MEPHEWQKNKLLCLNIPPGTQKSMMLKQTSAMPYAIDKPDQFYSRHSIKRFPFADIKDVIHSTQ